MTDHRTIIDTFTRIEEAQGGAFRSDAKQCAQETAEELGIPYEQVREALLVENGGLFG